MVILPSGKVMIIGHFTNSKNVILFDPATERFDTSLPFLKDIASHPRPSCAVFQSAAHNFRSVVLVMKAKGTYHRLALTNSHQGVR